MTFRLWTLAVLLASSAALSPSEIPGDLPVSSLLTSAQTHLSKGETSEALVYYDAAITRDPSNYLTLFKRGATYLSLGRTNQATDDFNQVLTLKPGFEGAHMQLARIKSKIGDWDAARAELLAANKTPEHVELVELDEAKGAAKLAQEAMDKFEWDDCINHASTAIMVANRATGLRQIRSLCRLQRGDIEEGLADLQHVLNLNPSDAGPHMVISATLFYGLGDLDNGLAQVRKCLHSDPDSKVCKKLHKQQKAIKKSLDKVHSQLQRGQTTTAGRGLTGTAEDAGLISDIKDQIKNLRESGDIPPMAKAHLYETVVELACQAFVESNHRDVKKYCDESLGLNPESFWAKFHSAKQLLQKEDYESSVRVLKELAEAHPDKRDKINPLLQKADVLLRRSKTKDYYKVLGVVHDADEKQIKSAYRKASKQYHPDKAHKQGYTKEEAEKKMASINEAYEVLSDPELRARFDRGDDPNSQERQGNPFHGSPFGQGGSPFGGGHPFGGGKTHFQFQHGGQRKGQQQQQQGGWPFGF